MGLNYKAKGQAMGDSLASHSLLKGVWEGNVFECMQQKKLSNWYHLLFRGGFYCIVNSKVLKLVILMKPIVKGLNGDP